jgi:uncharacterized protein YceK
MTKKCYAVLTVAILLSGCDPMTKTSSPESISDVGTSITYFKDDQHAICFGMLQSASYGFYNVVSITAVPCDKVNL